MEQLLKITVIPLQLQIKTTRARLELKQGKAELNLDHQRGGFKMNSRPAELHINTRAARDSVIPSLSTVISRSAQKGKQAAYDATAETAKEGQLLVRAQSGDDVLNQIFAQRTSSPIGDFTMGFIPTTGPDINYVPNELNVQYDLDKLNFNWKISNGNLTFIPGEVNFEITQYPDVIVEYIGGPMYIPPRDDSTINIRA